MLGTLQQRLMEKVTVDENGCWVFNGAKQGDGYGMIFYDGREVVAHRASWILVNGDIPEGLLVLHQCDNRPCINPGHLFLGTQKENMTDKVRKGRHAPQKGEQNNCAKLTDAIVRQMKSEYEAGEVTTIQLAAKYGCGRRTVRNIMNGISWKHI